MLLHQAQNKFLKNNCCLLVCSPNACNGLYWVKPKPGSKDSTWVSHLGGRHPHTCCLQDKVNRRLTHPGPTPIWAVGVPRNGLICSAPTPTPSINFGTTAFWGGSLIREDQLASSYNSAQLPVSSSADFTGPLRRELPLVKMKLPAL